MYRGQKRYAPTRGIDLKSSDVLRSQDFLSDSKNIRYDGQHNLIKRPGFQQRIGVSGSFSGLYPFKTTDYLGNTKTELLWFASYIYRVGKATISIANTHASSSVNVFIGESSGYKLIVSLGGTAVLTRTIDPTGGADTVAASVAAIHALADIACTSSSTTYDSSFFSYGLDLQVNEVVSPGATRTIDWYYLEAVNRWTNESSYNPTIDGNRGSADFQMTSAVTLNNVLYVAYSNRTSAIKPLSYLEGIFSGLLKYDGQNAYRAGLPTPNMLVTGSAAAGAVTDVRGDFTVAAGTLAQWLYKATFISIDKAGNVIESGINVACTDNANTGGHVARTVTFDNYPNINATNMMRGAAYNNHVAYSSSAMAGTSLTIPCDNGAGGAHTLQVGDVAYFWDRNQNRNVARLVLSRTAAEIQVSGASIEPADQGGSVRLYDNAVISNNVRIAIWRTKGTSGSYYLLGEYPIDPNDAYNGTIILHDNYDDAQLGAILIEEEKIAGLPPYCTSISTYGNKLIVSGGIEDKNTVHFSEEDNVENFPAATNSFILPYSPIGHAESGGTLNVFGEDDISSVIGDLTGGNFRVEALAANIGCVSHASISKISEGELFFLSKRGPMKLVNGRQIAPLGTWQDGITSRLEPYFTTLYPSFDSSGRYLYKPKFSLAISAVDPEEKLYIMCVPWTTDFKPHHPSPYPLDHAAAADTGYTASQTPAVTRCMSDTWVYDYGKDSWTKWQDIDFSGGLCYFDRKIWGSTLERSAGKSYLFTLNEGKYQYNYQDYGAVDSYPVSAEILTNWESLGEPDLWKKFLWLTMSSVGSRESSTFSVTLTTYPNYDTALVAHTSAVMEFVAKLWKRVKLKSAKMNSIQLKFANADVNETFSISGWELVFATSYEYPASASGGTQG